MHSSQSEGRGEERGENGTEAGYTEEDCTEEKGEEGMGVNPIRERIA